jgi:hypothetical protein
MKMLFRYQHASNVDYHRGASVVVWKTTRSHLLFWSDFGDLDNPLGHLHIVRRIGHRVEYLRVISIMTCWNKVREEPIAVVSILGDVGGLIVGKDVSASFDGYNCLTSQFDAVA